MSEILWCCHVRGPDDVYAAPDYDTALAWSDCLNAANWRGRDGKTERPESWEDCLIKAAPAVWPWDAAGHAEAVRRDGGKLDAVIREAKRL